MRRARLLTLGLLLAVFGALVPAAAQELPRPNYANSVVVGIEHSVWDDAEIAFMKSTLPFGLYARLSLSFNNYAADLAWHSDWANASQSLGASEAFLDSLIAAAKRNGVGIHLVLTSGIERKWSLYREAKEEDVRNCQWYNDNKLAADSQVVDPDFPGKYAFGSLSRYARKLGANVEAKSRAFLAILKEKMDENPDLLITISGWGETEHSYLRTNDAGVMYLADYSPFAVLEFRDWIRHSGLYDDAAGPFKGEGYAGGVDAFGAPIYQGTDGLARFNSDFGTAFADWRLKYFDWSLGDDYDHIPQDEWNPDPNRIPLAAYAHGGMMPASGPDYIAGGFDPPRTRTPGTPFWNLWDAFREAMVHHHSAQFARWASESGIPSDRVYSHQIPGDYLFGNTPSSAQRQERYITSASSLQTADNQPHGSAGVTVFDVKFGEGWFVRTSDHLYPAIAAMSPNWGILEFDPETYPTGFAVPQSDPEVILEQYLRPYEQNAHIIVFFLWEDAGEHRIQGTNKEVALRDFVLRIRDKGRNPDPGFVFTPPAVFGLTASGEMTAEGVCLADSADVELRASGEIWDGESWEWTDWGDFLGFRVYRGFRADFVVAADSLIGETESTTFVDAGAPTGTTLYYKWRAENAKGILGPESAAIQVLTPGTPVPWITLDTKALAFQEEIGTPSGAVSQVRITNDGGEGTVLNWRASADADWLRVDPPSGTGPGTLNVSVDQTGLAAGAHVGQITISDPAAPNSPRVVSVALNLYAQIIASLSVEPESLTFSVELGETSADQTAAVKNTGTPGTVLHWTASANQAWIGLEPAGRTGDGNLTVRAAGLSLGDHTGKITVEDPGALGSPATIAVTVHVVPPPAPRLFIEKKAFIFGGEAGMASPTVQKTLVQNSGPPGTVLEWQASADSPWILLGPASGTGGGWLEIKADPTSLASGSYNGQVQIFDPAADDSPQSIAVSLKVFPEGGDSAPFGYMDSPAEGALVAASIPVTGWALDDIEATTIEIWRDPVLSAGEVSSLYYIGDAVFVKNARPDIEAAHPDFPLAYRAGWGYMLLTNFLPNRGNGTFTLHAFALDAAGHRTALGQRTIVCDNAHSVLPFGTLDTPAQGGTASGDAYINWGWALTPPPNALPADGSTIWVWVDGVPLGHPAYGNYRADVAGLFPEYLNAGGAVGYFYLDTTKYANGTHTISWGLTDNAGNASGIGSRYFEVINVGSGAAPSPPAPFRFSKDRGGRLEIGLVGPAELEVQELERVIVCLRAKGGAQFVGWGETSDRALPVGSTLDERTGVFSWIPGPGFLGRHVLHFAVTDGSERSRDVKVAVRIVPRRPAVRNGGPTARRMGK